MGYADDLDADHTIGVRVVTASFMNALELDDHVNIIKHFYL